MGLQCCQWTSPPFRNRKAVKTEAFLQLCPHTMLLAMMTSILSYSLIRIWWESTWKNASAKARCPHSHMTSTGQSLFTSRKYMQQIKLCCECLMPETWDDMVICDQCEEWHHLKCVGLQEAPSKEVQWLCRVCVNCLYLCVIILICPSLVILIYNNSLLVRLVCLYINWGSKYFTGSPNISTSSWNISSGVQTFWNICSEELFSGGQKFSWRPISDLWDVPFFDLASMLGSSCGQTVFRWKWDMT